MADQPIKLTPLGNLDKDTDYNFIKEGNYVDALDVIKQDDTGNVSGTTQPTQRNKHAFSLGEVVAQNKKYRITVPSASGQYAVEITSPQGYPMVDYNGPIDFHTESGTAVQFYSLANWQAEGWTPPTGNINIFNVSYPTVNGVTVIELELTAHDYYNYNIESVGGDFVRVECIQEAIPTDLAGPLKDIGSYDLFGDLFIFSTTQDNEPTETDLNILGVGPLTTIGGQNYYTGPVTQITFSSGHNLQAGQSIRITDSNQTFLNGDFVVSVSSPTEIGVVTSTAWGNDYLVTSGTLGSEKITIHNKAIGEIGVAQKDNTTETWTYKRLLRSTQLNFITKYNIDCIGESDNRRSSFYFEDDFNESRVFYYSGQYFEEGALSHVSSENHYHLDYISVQTACIKKKANVIIELKEQKESGGDTPPGNIRYFCLLEDKFGNTGKPSDLSSIVITFSDNLSGFSAGDGDDILTTNKVNVLTVSSLNPIIHEKVRLGYYIASEGSSSAFLLGEEDIPSTTIDLQHIGSCGSEEYDVGNLATNFLLGYDFAKNTNVVDERLVRTNLRKKQITDFGNWAKTFKHRVKEKFIKGSSPNTAGEYQIAENGFDSLGYMLNESYRFGVRGVLKKTGEYTPWFWVDDIKIDPFPTNEGNPNDNRRDQSGSDTLTDYDLTKDLGNAWPTSRWAKVPYVEFFDIDKTYNIDGFPINLWLETIEFGRAEVIPEVLCSGIATMSVVIQGVQNTWYDVDSSATPLTPTDHGRTMSFPFNTIEQNNNAVGAYFISEPGENYTDSNKPRHEYPFVYGPPVMKYAQPGFNDAYPNGVVDGVPIYSYPTTNNAFFGDAVTTQNEPTLYTFTPWKSDRTILSIYSPDIFYGKVSDISGYDLLDFGEMLLPTSSPSTETFNGTFNSGGTMYSLYSKYFPENFSDNYNIYDIKEWRDCSPGSIESFGGVKFRKGFGVAHRVSEDDDLFVVDNALVNIQSPVVFIDNNGNGVTDQAKNIDYGVRYIQLYKKIEDKYCSYENTTYYTTNNRYRLSDMSDTAGIVGKNICEVFGGDTFTQCTYLKGRYMNWDVVTSAGATSWTDYGWKESGGGYSPGFAGGFKFYSQNRVNSQMRFADDNEINFPANSDDIVSWLDEDEGKTDLLSYSSSFTPILSGILQPSYEGQYLDEVFDYPQRIEYSERKIRGSMSDDYLNRLPLNIKDLDLSFGEIIHHENINGELFTLQPRKYQLQYFNTRGTLQGSNIGVEVLIGDASVLSRDGQTLSSYGTNHKWSVVKGSSPGGKDVIYWFNQENGLFMRFGADGTVVLSERNGIRSFAANNTRWTENQYTPALNYGIRSVWDDRFKEAIWTFIGVRDSKGEWGTLPSNQPYAEGDTVTNNTFINYPFDGVPDVYISLALHYPIPQSEPGVGIDWETYWKLADKDDPEYYSVFTLAFNELSNGFSTFYSHLPKTYLKWKNKFISSHPLHRNELYEHRYGYDKWYEYEGVWKESEPFVEGVVNYIPEQSKKFVAIQSLSDNVPDKIEFKTKDHESFLVSADFDPEDNAWRSPIKNDILTSSTSDPNDDTASLVGSYMRVKFKFFNGAYNKMNNLIIKIRARLRRTST